MVAIAVNDLGASASMKYDCEAWLPGRGATASSPRRRTRPTTSPGGWTSATGPAEGRPAPVHTLNGTAVAVGRTIIALLENGQQDDGSVRLPATLIPYGVPGVLPPA